ncbi:MAG: CRISPR-associated helicase Cas3' [Bacilli bacterium]
MKYFKSHPTVFLEEHLMKTLKWSQNYIKLSSSSILLKIDKQLINSYILFHDIGKTTAYFQEYINGEKIQDEQLKNHAFLSGIYFLYYCLNNNVSEENKDIILYMYMCIICHHSNLSSLKKVLNRVSDEKKDILVKQFDSINQEELKQLFTFINLKNEYMIHDMNKAVALVNEFLFEMRKKIVNTLNNDITDYFIIESLFSLLIDSDKSQVGIDDINKVNNYKYDIDVKKYIDKHYSIKNNLDNLRQNALEETSKSIIKQYNNSIFALTLPTGMGKTLNSFNTAIELKKILENIDGVNRKIIYVMPFMSIIDQNANAIENVLKYYNYNDNTAILLKHHHLSELKWSSENIIEDKQISKMLIEGWNSQIIVTTFIQFFETIIGYRNSSQRKFNKINNSIIIIDEIQSLPIKYYNLVQNMMAKIANKMNCKIIVMTATQPKIFEAEQYINLCECEKYYKVMNRTKIVNKITNKQTVSEFVENIVLENNKSYLIILNTIRCVNDMYNYLVEKYGDKRIGILNTNIIPEERKRIIEKIKNNEYDIVISTQLVEAGVDIDLDVVYRDLAPVPQIIQSAGRCNRNSKNQSVGEIQIVNLIADNGKSYSNYIYDVVELELTKKVFNGINEIFEKDYLNFIQKYFEYACDSKNIISQIKSKDILNGIKSCKFYCDNDESGCVSDFKLINNDENYVSIFIEFNNEAIDIWKEYQRISSDVYENIWDKKADLDNIMIKMNKYIINYRINKTKDINMPPLDNNKFLYYVQNDELDKYYDNVKGFGKEGINIY